MKVRFLVLTALFILARTSVGEPWAGLTVDSGATTSAVVFVGNALPADAPYRNPSLDVEKRIDDLVPRLLPEEKAKLLHAVNGLCFGNIPRIGLELFRGIDAGMGPRAERRPGITGFPAPIAYAATFDRDLVREIGRVMAEETRGIYPASEGGGICRMLLGPGANIARVPVNARNFEYFGEDPRLSGETAAAWIAGLQSVGVGCCMKHYCFNEQEYSRLLIDVECPERAVREIYTRPWEIAIRRTDPWAFMNSYNRFRGEWTSHSAYLNDMLAKEYGATGAFIPDWGGYHGDVKAINGGTTIESACSEDPKRDRAELDLVKEGKIDRRRFDDAVRRALRLYFRIGAFDGATAADKALQARCEAAFHSPEHQAVARRAAEESFVLVRNEGDFLPVGDRRVRIAVLGPYADMKHNMSESDTSLFQHGGSVAIKAAAESTPLAGFRKVFGADNVLSGENALDLAKAADIVVYCGGIDHSDESEAGGGGHVEPNDRRDLFLRAWNGRVQEDEIRAIAAVNSNVVVALTGGAPVSVEEWHESVRAIFMTWYGGEFGGETLARMVKGEINPSGKLPYTYGKTLHDWPSIRLGHLSYPGEHSLATSNSWERLPPRQVYLDGIWVGYRGFDHFRTGVRYPFGFGLGYTTFAVRNLKLDGSREATVDVVNVGGRKGRCVVQCYVSKPAQPDAEMPVKELADFSSVELAPGESREVRLSFDDLTFSYWSDTTQGWRIAKGRNRVLVGFSSADLPLRADLMLPCAYSQAGHLKSSSGEKQMAFPAGK